MPTRLKRLIAPTDSEAAVLGKLTEAILPGLDGDVRRQVTATGSDASHVAESKWQRAVTESVATLQGKVGDIVQYDPLEVQAFALSVSSAELGQTVPSLTLTWSYNKEIQSQRISGPIGSLLPNLTSYVLRSPTTSSTVFTLTASDGTTTASAIASLTFYHKRYWGASSSDSLTDVQVLALSGSEFSTSRSATKTITAADQYLYFAYPASFGEATFTVNGMLNTAWILEARVLVNAFGYAANYNIYRSQYKLTGTYLLFSL